MKKVLQFLFKAALMITAAMIIAYLTQGCSPEEEEVGCGCELVTYKRDKQYDEFAETDREPTDICERGFIQRGTYTRIIIECN